LGLIAGAVADYFGAGRTLTRQLAQIEECQQRLEDFDIRSDWRAASIWAE
jgi:hypothetical protein